MVRKINSNKFGVIEYAIDTEEDLEKLPRKETDNTVYAILNKNGKRLVYLYSKELKNYILINGDLEEINVELENINEQLEDIAHVSFENFKIDNINERLLNAFNYCYLNNKKIISNKNTYTLRSPITFTNFTNVDGNGCTIITSDWLDEDEHAITFKNIQNVVIENVNFEISQSCHSWSCVGLLNCNNVKFVNCKFSSFSDVAQNTHGVLDVYRENTNILFENCTFNQLSDSTAGGIWVRNGNSGVTDNVKFINCTFNKKGADEVLAIWGWQGTVKNIKVENCKFNVYKSINN